MTEWKIPPKAKIYEALSAFADGRVHIKGSNEAEVKSSAGDKTYSIRWSDDITKISSNDNASYWQGYIGYPIVTVLMALGKLNFNTELAKLLVGIPWKEVNDKFKRDYDKAIDSVLQEIEAKGGDRASIIQQVDSIFAQIKALKLERGPKGAPPPKGKKGK